MRPIDKVKSRSMSGALRAWLKSAVTRAGLAVYEQKQFRLLKHKTLLSAARAAGIQLVPAI